MARAGELGWHVDGPLSSANANFVGGIANGELEGNMRPPRHLADWGDLEERKQWFGVQKEVNDAAFATVACIGNVYK